MSSAFRVFLKLTLLFFVLFFYVTFIVKVYVFRSREIHRTYSASAEQQQRGGNDDELRSAVFGSASSSLSSLSESRVIPFVFNATLRSSLEITLVTSAYVDELERIDSLADVWHGPISLSVCMPLASRDIDRSTAARFFAEHSAVQRNVDMHFVETNDAACSFTALRNAAIELSRTEWFLSLNSRQVPSSNAHISLLRSIGTYFDQRQQKQENITNRVAFVLPAFASSTITDARDLPSSKRELTRAVRLGTLDRLDETRCIQCQEPLDVERWFVTKQHYSITLRANIFVCLSSLGFVLNVGFLICLATNGYSNRSLCCREQR